MTVTRVCLYTRISTDEENQPTSLHSQRERLEAFCKAQGDWRIVAHYEDRATGTKLDRPGLQGALELAREGRVDLLLVYRVDRLSRKVRQLAQLAEELDALGVVLRSATEPFDTGSAAGRMMLQIFELYTRGRLGTAAIARTLAAEQAPAPAAGWQPAVVQLILDNEAYLGRVIWRRQSLPGLHEPLIDDVTFHRARRLLRERGEDMALRRSNPSDYLLSGLIRCGRCRRAYVGMSARGNGGTYHYYACTGRQKLGRAGCDGERIPRDKLEAAVLEQLASLYQDGVLIRTALDEAAAKQQAGRPQLEERRRSLTEEIRRGERALDRYYQAFENGDLDSVRFQTRVSALETHLDALREQDAGLALQLAPEADTAPDSADLEAVADRLERTIAEADPRQAKALLRLLIKELKVNGRSEILPTYRVVTPEVCAPPSSVGAPGIEPGTSRV